MAKKMRNFSLVVATSIPEYGIGYKNDLPWKISADMKFFQKTTSTTIDKSKQNAVIMGRKTWDSIPLKYRPLKNRLNIILTRNPDSQSIKNAGKLKNVLICVSFEMAIESLTWSPYDKSIENIYIIGGTSLYNESLKYNKLLNKIYLTKVYHKNNKNLQFDTFFKFDINKFNVKNITNIIKTNDDNDKENYNKNDTQNIEYQFCVLTPKIDGNDKIEDDVKQANQIDNQIEKKDEISKELPIKIHEEYQYLNLIENILKNGIKRGDRTGTGTYSIFGAQMRFDLTNNIFPLLTTKRVFWRGVAEELLWFISGSTSAKLLQDKNIRIWDGNSTREFLDNRGLNNYEVGDLGPVYGFQWRHFGAKYKDMHTDYTGQGVDQLAECIKQIKTNPNSRRIVMSAWNPSDLNKMALPPCHMFVQFYVANNELSCQMYQRSADLGLGVPFNIASYALLTRLVAQVCGLKAKEFIHTIGDAHVYLNHVKPLQEQLKREPKPFPKLIINQNKTNIDDFEFKDFEIIGYKPHKTIKMKMAV